MSFFPTRPPTLEINMKKIFLILLFSSVCLGQQLETAQYSPVLIHRADANDTALDPNTSSWAVCKLWTPIPVWSNGLKVKFFAYDPNDPNDETFSYQLYVADYYSNAELVCSGSATVGGSKMSANPVSSGADLNSGAIDPNYAWVDTLGSLTSVWMDTDDNGAGNGVTKQNDGGLNGVASLIFDRQCARFIWCRIYSRSNAYLQVYAVFYGY